MNDTDEIQQTQPQPEVPKSGISRRGFASMTPERRKEIARMGGKSAHALGVAHRFTVEEARAAGRKGGLAVSADLQHMSRIGSIGGRARGKDATVPPQETETLPAAPSSEKVEGDQ